MECLFVFAYAVVKYEESTTEVVICFSKLYANEIFL